MTPSCPARDAPYEGSGAREVIIDLLWSVPHVLSSFSRCQSLPDDWRQNRPMRFQRRSCSPSPFTSLSRPRRERV